VSGGIPLSGVIAKLTSWMRRCQVAWAGRSPDHRSPAPPDLRAEFIKEEPVDSTRQSHRQVHDLATERLQVGSRASAKWRGVGAMVAIGW